MTDAKKEKLRRECKRLRDELSKNMVELELIAEKGFDIGACTNAAISGLCSNLPGIAQKACELLAKEMYRARYEQAESRLKKGVKSGKLQGRVSLNRRRLEKHRGSRPVS